MRSQKIHLFLKAKIRGKSRLRTDVYYSTLFDLVGYNSISCVGHTGSNIPFNSIILIFEEDLNYSYLINLP